MDFWQGAFLVFILVSLTGAIAWDSVLGNKFKNIETRQLADPRLRPYMDLSKIPGSGRAYRAKDQALRLAEPERSAALRECARLQTYIRIVCGLIGLVFLAMVVSLLIR
ncbi:hypothetical protein DEVEQU_03300 [Devosia equisanguinis]|uniref:Uncharacterized protein n=1 Tax=Devosia equisanguinis TaxID=2490941 RepID=A0A447IF65_9HYPH|nr:hypothetical protein [Devosia equisanguinis]VDS06147.1 hypothetical protein DEVEQU_03300 [Devosia equisanguinis]